MVNIIDTPPHTASATDRDRVSLLEIVGCSALLSTLVWTIISMFHSEPVFRTPTLLSTYGPWVAASVTWATLLTIAVKSFGRVTAVIVSVVGGAFLPLAVFFGGIAREGESSPVGVVAATIAMMLTTSGTILPMAAPRRVRGIAAIVGFLAILVFFTWAFGQAFLSSLQPASGSFPHMQNAPTVG